MTALPCTLLHLRYIQRAHLIVAVPRTSCMRLCLDLLRHFCCACNYLWFCVFTCRLLEASEGVELVLDVCCVFALSSESVELPEHPLPRESAGGLDSRHLLHECGQSLLSPVPAAVLAATSLDTRWIDLGLGCCLRLDELVQGRKGSGGDWGGRDGDGRESGSWVGEDRDKGGGEGRRKEGGCEEKGRGTRRG